MAQNDGCYTRHTVKETLHFSFYHHSALWFDLGLFLQRSKLLHVYSLLILGAETIRGK